MKRMALFCSLLVVGLTAAAVIDHERAPDEPGEESARVSLAASPAPAAAGVAPTSRLPAEITMPPPETPPAIDERDLVVRIEEEIIQPIEAAFLERMNFSRVRTPSREIELRMRPGTDEERPPREDGREYVYFELDDARERFSRGAPRRRLAYGRVHARTGVIELALVRGKTVRLADRAYEPAAEVLRALGVKADPKAKPADAAAVKKRHW